MFHSDEEVGTIYQHVFIYSQICAMSFSKLTLKNGHIRQAGATIGLINKEVKSK